MCGRHVKIATLLNVKVLIDMSLSRSLYSPPFFTQQGKSKFLSLLHRQHRQEEHHQSVGQCVPVCPRHQGEEGRIPGGSSASCSRHCQKSDLADQHCGDQTCQGGKKVGDLCSSGPHRPGERASWLLSRRFREQLIIVARR